MDLAKSYLAPFIAPVAGPNCRSFDLPLHSLQDQVKVLEKEFIDYIRSGTEPDSEPGKLVFEMAGRVGSDYKAQFEEFLKNLDLTPETVLVTWQQLAAECLEVSPQSNWGRVATVLSFSRLIAEKLSAANGGDHFLETFSTFVGQSLARFVVDWRSREGRGDLGLNNKSYNSSFKWSLTNYFGAFLKMGAIAVNCANEAIK